MNIRRKLLVYLAFIFLLHITRNHKTTYGIQNIFNAMYPIWLTEQLREFTWYVSTNTSIV